MNENDNEMRKLQFKKVKDDYTRIRQEEKVKIANFLQDHHFTILALENNKETTPSKRLGSGRNGLANWQYIYAQNDKNKNYFYISLQCFDEDKKSGNRHVVMDRIGFCVESKDPKGSFPDAFDKMIDADIDLPVDDDNLNELLKKLNDAEPQ